MRFRDLHPNIKLRLAVGFVQRFLGVMLMPLMVIHLAASYGAAVAGVLILVVAAAGIGSAFLGGHLADIHGRRPLMLWGEAGSAVTFAGLAVANSPWWESGPLTFALFLLNVCLSNMAQPAADAMVIDVSSPENRPLVYTVNYWTINIAFTLGALVGGFLYHGHFTELLLGGAVLSVGTTLVIRARLSETAPNRTGRSSPGPGPKAAAGGTGVLGMFRGYLAVARDRAFFRLLLAAVLTRSIEVQIGYYIAVRLAEEFPEQVLVSFGDWAPLVNGVEMLGILRAVNTALVVALALVAGSLLRRCPARLRLYAGLAAFTGGYMVWAVSNTGWVLIAAAVLLTIGEIANVPVKQTLLADLVDPGARTKYLAAYSLNARIGLLIGAACVTIGTYVPPAGMAAGYAACGLGAIVLYRSLFRIRHERRIDGAEKPAGPGPAAAAAR
ncbi:MFS transporter [Streptomyces sodiiphilus]|uniref:MFS transporter n=1 Tax=Streptomyces sodiiphilus TaxID=226217 RepID=A0ABN2NTF2_9ACTN